jgi:phage terminase small subunit
MSTAGGLNPKQKLFVAEYLKDKNGKQAAIRAGYSPKTAEVQASRLLSVAKVRTVVDESLEKLHKKLDISAERIREELARIAFADMADHVSVGTEGEVRIKPFDEMPEGSSRSISGIKEKRRILSTDSGDTILEATLEYKHHDKVRALELLGKDQNMFKEKVEHTGPDGGPIQIQAIEVTFVRPGKD